MSEAASMIAKTAFQQSPDAQTNVKSQSGGGKSSFDAVLQNNPNQNETQNMNVQNVAPVGNENRASNVPSAQYNQLQTDLTNKISQINGGQAPANKGEILPELLYTKSRLTLLKEATAGVNNAPNGKEIMGRFSYVENEYKQVEAIMKSNKDLSPGELLGLQARLYQVSQHIEVMSKVVDQVTGGIKTILNTNI